jgi:hypothetical protein
MIHSLVRYYYYINKHIKKETTTDSYYQRSDNLGKMNVYNLILT